MLILFVCDSGNGCIRAVDFARPFTRSGNRVTLDVPCDEELENEDDIPIERKITVTTTLALRSTSRHFLQRPFSICTGRKLLQEYADGFVRRRHKAEKKFSRPTKLSSTAVRLEEDCILCTQEGNALQHSACSLGLPGK